MVGRFSDLLDGSAEPLRHDYLCGWRPADGGYYRRRTGPGRYRFEGSDGFSNQGFRSKTRLRALFLESRSDLILLRQPNPGSAPMAYVENRVVHDADSHLMEMPDSLDAYFDPKFRAAYDALPKLQKNPRDAGWVKKARAMHEDPDFRAGADSNVLLRKNYEAHGSFRREDRPRTLDNLGFASQLIFTTWCLGNFNLDEGGPVDLAYATAEAHNRMMVDFCSVDRRFLGTGYVPLVDFERAIVTARNAIAMGCKALLVPSKPPKGHSPSHIAHDPIWAMAQEAGLPI